MVSVDQGGTISFWMLDNGQRVKNTNGIHPNAEVTSIAQDSSGTLLYTGATDGSIKVHFMTFRLACIFKFINLVVLGGCEAVQLLIRKLQACI